MALVPQRPSSTHSVDINETPSESVAPYLVSPFLNSGFQLPLGANSVELNGSPSTFLKEFGIGGTPATMTGQVQVTEPNPFARTLKVESQLQFVQSAVAVRSNAHATVVLDSPVTSWIKSFSSGTSSVASSLSTATDSSSIETSPIDNPAALLFEMGEPRRGHVAAPLKEDDDEGEEEEDYDDEDSDSVGSGRRPPETVGTRKLKRKVTSWRPTPEHYEDLTDHDIAFMDFKDLTQMMIDAGLSSAQITDLKARRRRLKNRQSARLCSNKKRELCSDLQTEKSKLTNEKSALEQAHQNLKREHQLLKQKYDALLKINQ